MHFPRVGLLRNFSDLDIPDSSQPTKRRAAYETDWFERELAGIFPFKRKDDRCDLSKSRHLTVDMKHFRLEEGGTKNAHLRLVFRKCRCQCQCQLGPGCQRKEGLG